MKQTPILFSTEMVQAILAGRKSQTRRVVKVQRPLYLFVENGIAYEQTDKGSSQVKCPYGSIGDVLWVREEHLITFSSDRTVIYIEYKDGFSQSFYYKDLSQKLLKRLYRRKTIGKWQRARFLPKEFARMWLRINANRIERLQDISEEDCVAEGVASEGEQPWYKDYIRKLNFYPFANPWYSFKSLWNSINGEDSWNANPCVWVIEFERTNPPAADTKKMTAHSIWRKVKAENLTDEQHKQLLIDNGIIVKK